jgi:hypothetical protein
MAARPAGFPPDYRAFFGNPRHPDRLAQGNVAFTWTPEKTGGGKRVTATLKQSKVIVKSPDLNIGMSYGDPC